MQKSSFLIALLILLALPSFAKQVDENTAKQAGQQFLTAEKPSSFGRQGALQLVYVSKSNVNTSNSSIQSTNYFYVFNAGTKGFVIIAGDDIVTPVLGYSDEGSFDPDNIPRNAAKWFEGYKNQIRYAIDNNMPPTEEISADWKSLKDGTYVGSAARGKRNVDPLISTRWDQSPYYNDLCPGGSVTGCVATAMAQIIRYWQYPATGAGFHSYNHDVYGTLSANFGNTTYDYASMPVSISGPNTAIATLMFHCGVSVDMGYSPQESGAWVIEASNTPEANSEYALKTYFSYPNTLKGVERANYSDADWLTLVKTDLDAGRPVLYDGFGTGGGHCFDADGYDGNNFIHFNWGWSGNYDGYFEISALNPGGVGTGGGTGGFNSGQQAVIKIEPPAGSQPTDIALYSYVTPSDDPIYYGNAFSVTTNVANYATGTFNGDYCAAIFDSDDNFVDYVEIKTGFNLAGNSHYVNNLVFSTTGIFGMLPGAYSIGIYYRPAGGNWIIASDNGNYSNFVQVTVINPNDIELYSPITVMPGTTLTQGQPASANLNIINNGTGTFYGQYAVGLYNLDGSFVQEIGTVDETDGLPSGYIYNDPFLTFITSSITATPGTYLLAVLHNPNNTGWQLTGSTNYQNPITVTVVAPSIMPDIYEPNNTIGQGYNLHVAFMGNNDVINTVGSNYHFTGDDDFYKIILPAGYDYAIVPRLHDSYNSGNGNTYTFDGLFSYTTDGNNWSDAYDDVFTGNLVMQNGGTIYFHVAPYFAGETGTYLLEMNVTRSPLSAVEETVKADAIKLYPNPANQFVNLSFVETDLKPQSINLYGIDGKLVYTQNIANNPDSRIPTGNLPGGLYIIKVKTETGVWVNKFDISH